MNLLISYSHIKTDFYHNIKKSFSKLYSIFPKESLVLETIAVELYQR
ncbi:hypothetical protein LEQ41_02430 [Streptococcus agalactiae]|nr:hypothetical protein [Streptococcus agalactiae]